MELNHRAAQGTIEYLVILAVIVVVSLIVVSLMINSTAPAQGISESQSKIYWQSQPISITEAIADSQGDAIITLKPQENVTVKSITINNEEIDIPDTRIVAGNPQVFLLETSIICSGQTSSVRINAINYVTDGGLSKTVSGSTELVIECNQDVSSNSVLTEYVETNAPVVTLLTLDPIWGPTYSTGYNCGVLQSEVIINDNFTYDFTVTDDTGIQSCSAISGSTLFGTVTSEFTSIIAVANVDSFFDLTNTLAIVCTDIYGNVGWSDVNATVGRSAMSSDIC